MVIFAEDVLQQASVNRQTREHPKGDGRRVFAPFRILFFIAELDDVTEREKREDRAQDTRGEYRVSGLLANLEPRRTDPR